MTEVGEDVILVTAGLSGQGLHGIQTGVHHPRAQRPEPRLGPDSVGAVGADVLQGLTYPADPSGPGPTSPQAVLCLQLKFDQGWRA